MTPPLVGEYLPWRGIEKHAPLVIRNASRAKYLLRNRKANGLDKFLVWIGREPLIAAGALDAWIATQVEKVV